MTTKYLLVIDGQNDFITGSLRNEEAIRKLPNILKKVKETDVNETMIIATQDTHGENYLETLEGQKLPVPHCIYSSWGWQIEDELYRLLTEVKPTEIRKPFKPATGVGIVTKPTFGSLDLLEGIYTEVEDTPVEFEIIGYCTDICVISNALLLRAKFPNAKITVDASCCAGITPELHKAALAVMKSCQIDVVNEE